MCVVRGSSLYGDGVCLELSYQGRCGLYLGASGGEQPHPLGGFRAYGGFSLGCGWYFYSLEYVGVVGSPICGNTFGGRYPFPLFDNSQKSKEYFYNVFIHQFDKITPVGLLLTLIILFSFQGEIIVANPFHIMMIAVPLIAQTFLIFFLAFGWAKKWGLPQSVSAPAGLIGASNFFELAVAVAISLFGLNSGASLATVVGVLVEVPVMLVLVKIANKFANKNSL